VAHQAQVDVISVIAGIFLTVAIASLRQTPIYEAVGRIAVNKADPISLPFQGLGSGGRLLRSSDLDTEVRILQSDLMACR